MVVEDEAGEAESNAAEYQIEETATDSTPQVLYT